MLHWLLLPNPGPADAFYTTTGHIVNDVLTAHQTMLRYNFALTAGHPDSSRAWTWPLMKVVPFFWQGQGALIYMVGNPVIWWGSTLVLLGILISGAIMRPLGIRLTMKDRTSARPWPALAGYAIAYLPLWAITRVSFMYHYLTPLLFALAFVLLWLERAGWVVARPDGRPRTSYLVVLGLGVLGYVLVSPLTYGLSVGTYDEWLAGLIRSWR
jgi:dolichyl-phosphate-mannose-protein mannosyltransferase